MSNIKSPVKSIADLRLYPISRRPKAVNRIVSSGDTIVAIDNEGLIYTNRVSDHTSYSFPNEPKRFDEVLTCLRKLNAISPNAVAQHAKLRDEARKARTQAWAARDLMGHAKLAGIKLTPQQVRQAKKLAKDH